MASSASFELNSQSQDSVIFWHSLKQAISTSSGFERWKLERDVHGNSDLTLDNLVQAYLRETLETLAY